jgi:Bacterial Ig-like domain (group 3)/FG-GAP-like repeat
MTPASSLRKPFLFLVTILIWTVPSEAGTFKNPALIDTTYDPIGVASADINHDGNLDVVYIDGLGSPALHVLLGNGDGTFAHGQDVALPAGICGYSNCVINVADVTNDGNLDIILGGGGTSKAQLAVFPGNGDGTFESPVLTTLPTNNGNYPALNGQMGIGDVDGNGTVDLVVADAANPQLYILLGDNTGKFTLKSTVTIYFTAQPRIYLRDLNSDGHLDIVAIDPPPGGVAHVLLGNGDGTFQTAVDYNDLPLFLADMDGDGHPDLVCIQYLQKGGYSVAIATGNPDGTFSAPSQVATPPANSSIISIADYTGDGLPDLVFSTPVGIAVMPSEGNLSYGTPISTVAGASSNVFSPPADLAAGDLNNDQHNDLAMGVDGGVLILLGNGDGSFVSADSYELGHTVGVAAVADFSGDGIPDIAVTVPATYPRLLLGTGSGTFSLGPDQNQSYTSQTPTGNLVTADFNGDGKLDLLSTQVPNGSFPDGESSVWFNAGNDTFSSPLVINGGQVLTADVNKDGRSDLVLLSDTGMITVMLGQANSTFTTVMTQQWQGAYGVAAIGDLNSDGKLDLLLYEGQALRLWLGNGDGTFVPSNLVTIPEQGTYGIFTGQQVTISDIDGDGKADIIIGPATSSGSVLGPLLILYGNGDGTFQSPQLIPVSHAYTQFVVADINGDNKPDLVLTDSSGIAVITNLGSRKFGAEDHYVGGQGISQLSVVDVNRDGFPDIVAANSGGSTVMVLLNQPNGKPLDGAASTGTLTITPAPSNYSQPVTLKIVMSAPAGSAIPSGTVALYVDGSYITAVSLASGSASYVYATALIPGIHTFVAAYNGDRTYSPESFAALQTVNPPVYPTTTALTAAPTAVLTSQTVRLTATVRSSVTVPAGWVTFLDGVNSLGAQQVDSTGVALLDTATLTAGAHQISAIYQRYQDSFDLHAIYQTSTSPAVTVTVNTIPTSTAVSVSNSSPTAGAVITFAASVTSGSKVPFGGVSFYDGSVLLGTTSLAGGTATFSTASLSAGSASITAVFNANATFAASTSPPLDISVAEGSPRLARSLVVVNLQNGETSNATLRAKVITLKGSAMADVTFLDEGSILGTSMPDSSGTAVLLASSLRSGVHSLSASFSGNSLVAPAVSPEFIEQWPPDGPGFSMNLSGESISVSSGHSEQLAINITPIGQFQQSVQLACGFGVPSGYACVFSPASLPGSGISHLTLQHMGNSPRSSHGRVLYGIGLGFFAFFITCGRTRRLHCLLLTIVLGLGLTLTGCGNPLQDMQPDLQVLSIRATSGSGAGLIIHSAEAIVKILPER